MHKKSLGALAKHQQNKPKFIDRDLPEEQFRISKHISSQYGSFIDKMRYLRERDAKKLSAINVNKLRRRSNLKLGFSKRFKQSSDMPSKIMSKIKDKLKMDVSRIGLNP